MKQVSYPAAQIAVKGASAPVDTGATVVMSLPYTSGGGRASFIRVAISGGAAHVRLSPTATSATISTGDSIVTSGEALWLNTLGMNAIAVRGAGTLTASSIIQVSPLEEGTISPPTV